MKELNTRLGGSPRVAAGCEYFLGFDALELVELGADGPLTGLNRSRYLLVEFPPGFILPRTEEVFHELSVLGTTPVIAHPERNLVFAREPARLARLLQLGALSQVTAGCLLGDFGRAARGVAHEFLRLGLVHVVASDAHSLDKRRPRLGAARQLVREEYGAELEELLFERNPSAIFDSEPL